MWRWIIRIYVSFVLFFLLLGCSGVLLIRMVHLLAKAGSSVLMQWVHSHFLFTMSLLGVLAGQVVLGSNFTGRGWFRSKSGQSYEGFKLEKIKPWTWLLVSPVFLFGVIAWFLEQSGSGVFSRFSFVNFYIDVLKPNCSATSWRYYALYPFCGVQLYLRGELVGIDWLFVSSIDSKAGIQIVAQYPECKSRDNSRGRGSPKSDEREIRVTNEDTDKMA